MSLLVSDACANAVLDAFELFGGASCKFEVWSGTAPTGFTAPAGTRLVQMDLPSDWMSAASARSKAKSGVWSGVAAATGIATFFRVTNNAGVAFLQGGVGEPGSGQIAIIDNNDININQVVTVVSFTLTVPQPFGSAA